MLQRIICQVFFPNLIKFQTQAVQIPYNMPKISSFSQPFLQGQAEFHPLFFKNVSLYIYFSGFKIRAIRVLRTFIAPLGQNS